MFLFLAHILFLFAVQSAPAQEAAVGGGQRQIELEIEEIEGATGYEIELTSVVTNKKSIFKMRKPLWRAKVRPGKYKMRLRSFDERGVAGEWADQQEFLVAFPPPKLLTPANDAVIKTQSEDPTDIEFKWQAVPGAESYRVDIFAITDEEPTATEGTLAPHTASQPIATATVSGTSHTFKLPVAQKFRWTATALMSTGEDGDAQPTHSSFTAVAKKLETPSIETPIDRYVQKLNWSRPPRSESFSYILSRHTPSGWKTVEKKSDISANEIDVDYNEPGGKYRLQVRAQSKHTETSSVAQMEFDVFNGNRSPAAVEEARLRDSMEKPTTWYAIASYLVTSVSYEGINADGDTAGGPQQVAFPDALGGTGRIGVGYFKPNSKTGYIGILDMSGLNIDGENVTFMSLEAHYAKRYYWGINQLRFSGGLFYKELPQSFKTTTEKFEHKKVSYIGPHIGADFWHPFSYKYGMQLNTRLYLSALTGSTPNGQDIFMTPSFQFGLMGSMRLSNRLLGFAGWAHRNDKIKYRRGTTNMPTNYDNEVNLTGNYLNLMLEYGF